MGVADERHHVPDPSQMSNVFRNDLIERVWIGRGVSDKALVVVDMVSAELHLRVEREVVSVFLQRLHVIAEDVVRAIGLRQNIREETVAHTDAEQPLDLSFIRNRSLLAEALKCGQEEHAASRLQHLTTFHNVRPFRVSLDDV